MNTRLHNNNTSGFKPKRLAHFDLGKFPVVGALPGTKDGVINAAKTWLGYAPTQTAIGFKKAVWDLGKDVFWENGVKNWGLEDVLTFGVTKGFKMVAGGIGNLIDKARSAIHHALTMGGGLAGYTLGSVAQPVLGLMGGHHLKFDVPVADVLMKGAHKVQAGGRKLAGAMKSGGGEATAAKS